MKHFLSCDWGSSVFRLKLVETGSLKTLAEVQNNQGISSTNLQWQQDAPIHIGGQSRFLFYTSVIASAVTMLEKKQNDSLSGVPVILSGMASSTLGMIQLPYKQLPFKTDGSDLKVERVEASNDFDHDVFVISGVCSDTDIMRGEETQIVGAFDPANKHEGLFILPGTHSKHILVKDNVVHGFRTYMTGELFALLSSNSTLTQGLVDTGEIDDGDKESFIQGVKDSVNSNLLNGLFRVRTRFILDQLPASHNRNYLSGLLIGTEVKDLIGQRTSITVVSSNIGNIYKIAMQTLDVDAPLTIITDPDVTVRGQSIIFANHNI
jgi:2-dehydro-3-deoxygalactonokinase